MYEDFYGFTGRPFQLNPDPTFFYGSRGHSSAYSYLKFGAYQGEGFIVVTGEIGAGKTTLVRALLKELDPQRLVAAQLVSTQLDEHEVLRAVAAAFGLPIKTPSKAELIATLEAYFTLLASRRQRALLIVDEAQNLTQQSLEELRLLSNFQLAESPLLQTFLVGQPELREKLRSPSMEQLRQRVIASYHLGPMDEAETVGYVEHRLRRVGWNGDPSFDADAFRPMFGWTGGLPRKINLLANRILLAAYLGEKHAITAVDVEAAVAELRAESGMSAPVETSVMPAASADKPARRNVVPLDVARAAVPEPIGVHEETDPNAANLRRRTRTKPREAARPEAAPLLCMVGTRPSYVKTAPLLRALAARTDVPPVMLVQVEQALEYAMGDQLYADLELPMPDLALDVAGGSSTVRIAETMLRLEPVLDDLRPRGIVICGDADTTLACALTASRKGVPVLHIDAGLRSLEGGLPEQNRVIIDRLSDVLYTSDKAANANLAREGIRTERVHFVGSLTADSLSRAREHAVPPDEAMRSAGFEPAVLAGPAGYGLIAVHAASHVDSREALTAVLLALRSVGTQLPLLWPMDPRTRANIEQFGLAHVLADLNVGCLPPQGYLEMIGLMSRARVVITDSGAVQEETTLLDVPCLTLGAGSERSATLVQGTNAVVPLEPAALAKAVAGVLKRGAKKKAGTVPEYWDGQAAHRIAAHLASWAAAGRRSAQERASA